MQRVVYESDADLVIGVVGEAFSGKFFTVFGAPLGQLEVTDATTVIDFDMRGILERTADELLTTAKELDGKETRCKVFCRFGYVSKQKTILEGQFRRVSSAHGLIDEVLQFMLGDTHMKSKVFKAEFRVEKKIERGIEDVSFLSILRFPCL